jgi:hypothetical protein
LAMRLPLFFGLLLTALPLALSQSAPLHESLDSDRDGLDDATEEALLQQFVPQFMVGRGDCSVLPAQFVPFQPRPVVQADNGTIYGQVFQHEGHTGQAEIHYYSLWRLDCGEMGHALDAEHVSALVSRDDSGTWKALYWYAAAHENTVCDASQISRATNLNAETHGPRIWISLGKHASFLSEEACTHGCGGDRCNDAEPMSIMHLINLGEISAPMNGATWTGSQAWPLANKLRQSDFTQSRTARVEILPASEIAWANPEKRHMQAAISGGNSGIGGAATGLRATNSALAISDSETDHALDSASNSTGSAVAKAWRGVKKALQTTAQKMPH